LELNATRLHIQQAKRHAKFLKAASLNQPKDALDV